MSGSRLTTIETKEQSVTKITDDILPIGYVPPVAQTSIPTEAAKKSHTRSSEHFTGDAKSNGGCFAKVENSSLPLAKIELYADNETMPFATCLAATDCHGVYTVIQSPLTIYFPRAERMRMAPLSRHLYRQDLLCPYSRHPPIYKSRSARKYPAQALASASLRMRINSAGINNHKVYAAIPGEPNPVLLKDCGAESNCAVLFRSIARRNSFPKSQQEDKPRNRHP